MNRSRRPHSFSSTYSRSRSLPVGLGGSHSAVIVLRVVLQIPEPLGRFREPDTFRRRTGQYFPLTGVHFWGLLKVEIADADEAIDGQNKSSVPPRYIVSTLTTARFK